MGLVTRTVLPARTFGGTEFNAPVEPRFARATREMMRLFCHDINRRQSFALHRTDAWKMLRYTILVDRRLSLTGEFRSYASLPSGLLDATAAPTSLRARLVGAFGLLTLLTLGPVVWR